MGYLSSCRADSSIATCRSISSISPIQPSKISKSPEDTQASPSSSPSTPSAFHKFSYTDLQAATSNFSESTLLGRGSHGAVFKAVLKSGRQVAVKRPSRRSDEAENELLILSSVKSPRLVNLLGFASSTQFTPSILLVVEFMPNGTLYDLLHSNPNPPGWKRRIRIASQIAKAILTLHSCDPPVIHRDIKAANVLLDQNLDAKLGDFGLALRATTVVDRSTPPAGTLGYLDPAYVTPENLSTKTDVFSFGILLFEIMSGRKAIDVAHSPPSVVEWAVPMLRKGKVTSIYDPRIPPPRDPIARRHLAALAASCVRPNKDRRPNMSEIVEQLRVISKSLTSRVWNGIGNPCAVVETEKTISKISSDLNSRISGRTSGKLKELMARVDLEFALNGGPGPGGREIRTVPVLSVVKEVDEKNDEVLLASQKDGLKEGFNEKNTKGLLRNNDALIDGKNEEVLVRKNGLKDGLSEKSTRVLLSNNNALKGDFDAKIEESTRVLLINNDALKGELDGKIEESTRVLLINNDALKGELDAKIEQVLSRKKDAFKGENLESLMSKLDVLEGSRGKSGKSNSPV